MSKFIIIQKTEKFGDYIHRTVNNDERGWATNNLTKAYLDLGMGYGDCIPAQHAAVKLLWSAGHMAPVALVDADAQHQVFGICQNMDAAGWLKGERVVALTAQDGTYSMSVGDVLLSVADGRFFVVASYGMNEIDLGGGLR
jgi:hypothetical protein